MLKRTHHVTEQALEELATLGIGSPALDGLNKLAGRQFANRGDLLDALGQHAQPSKAEAKLIVKLTRPSLLRLEGIIPNREIREWVEALIFAFAVMAVVRTMIFAPFQIPTGSMIPTILEGDRIFATLYDYGLPVPLTGIKLFRQPVERGDIIIFPFPEDPSTDFIKRVVAVGGDNLELRGKRLYINGKPQDEPFAYYDPSFSASGFDQQFGPIQVPEGKLFVMGDNRYNSSDSRVWNYVDETTVKGRGKVIYWSHDPETGWLSGYRFSRIGKFLE